MRTVWVKSRMLLAGALASVVFLAASPLLACPYSIRDATFMNADDPARFDLYFIAPEEDSLRGPLEQWVEGSSQTWLTDANVDTHMVAPQDRRIEQLRDRLRDSAGGPPAEASVLLVSPKGETLVLSEKPADDLTMDDVMDSMVHTVESPARLAMRDSIVEAWCVVVLVAGDDPAETDTAKQLIEQAADQITGTTTEMNKVVSAGPEIIVVDRDDPAERVLLWSLGLAPRNAVDGEARGPQAVMLAGQGRQRGPIFEGEELTAENLLEAFTMLGRSCSCTTSPLWLSGNAVAMEWGAEMEFTAQIELGFDPNDPQALSLLRETVDRQSDGGGLGYSETLIISDAPRVAIAQSIEQKTEVPAAPAAAVSSDRAMATRGGETRPAALQSASDTERHTSTPPAPRTDTSTPTGFGNLAVMIAAAVGCLAVATMVVVLRGRTN